ncbi:hypothetical protein HMPREF9318_01692 [Streptococcus urinalis FB127-CNA-2]|uniref:Uncharacterized protein n=1 Tax=Streptococcus urinalis 2285-97 TaxID=764291 RepID=G5KET1_9STRE|nr:hypothetical protein STRUR_2140 [Streptococcus urinalis 2285-97]EKS18193.1 hypothetical protein HMPREF9318_01692 [Streptococcus urinalis FB127-CNA-2]VEF32982.1 Uncharacterised protein [Streptococcus urinalis]
MEDSLFKCLTCQYFVTTIDHIPIFEKRIEHFQNIRKAATNIAEKNFYEHLIKLNLAYLNQMYNLKLGTIKNESK